MIPTAAFVAASWADRIMSVQLEAHTSCVEGNPDLPLKSTYGDMAKNWAKTEVPLIAFGWALAKLNRKPTAVMYAGMATYGVAIHMHGVATGLRNCR